MLFQYTIYCNISQQAKRFTLNSGNHKNKQTKSGKIKSYGNFKNFYIHLLKTLEKS